MRIFDLSNILKNPSSGVTIIYLQNIPIVCFDFKSTVND